MRKSLLKNPDDRLLIARVWHTHVVDLGLDPRWRSVMVKDVCVGPYAGAALVLEGQFGLLSVFPGRRSDHGRGYVLAAGDIRTQPPRELPAAALTYPDDQPAAAAVLEELLSDVLHATAAAAMGVLRGTLDTSPRPAGLGVRTRR